MLGQVFMQLGLHLETVLADANSSGRAQSTMAASLVHFDPSSEPVDKISQWLVRYYAAQIKAMEHCPQYISVASDKSRALGTTLMQTSITLPDNSAMWCFPVALVVRLVSHVSRMLLPRVRGF